MKFGGSYDDFRKGGFEYVAFLIYLDTKDMKEDNWDEGECIEELADVCINARRMMIEKGYNPNEEIISCLENHRLKNPPDIITKCQNKYNDMGGYLDI